MRGILFYHPQPGALTFAHLARGSGPTSLLGDHDPYVMLRSGYPAGPDRKSTSVAFTVLNQDPDPDVLDDMRVSIEKVAASDPDATGSLESFEGRLRPWLEGSRELISVNGLATGGEHLAGDGAGAEPADGPEPVGSERLAPPPPPPSDEPTAARQEMSCTTSASRTASVISMPRTRGILYLMALIPA